MTIATILSRMQVLDNELDTASGGADETRAISALDMAQDAFEIYIANHPDLLGTAANTTTTADTETTTWPTGLMRIDTMWKMDTAASPNVPEYEIDVIQDVGGHRASDVAVGLHGLEYFAGRSAWVLHEPRRALLVSIARCDLHGTHLWSVRKNRSGFTGGDV